MACLLWNLFFPLLNELLIHSKLLFVCGLSISICGCSSLLILFLSYISLSSFPAHFSCLLFPNLQNPGWEIAVNQEGCRSARGSRRGRGSSCSRNSSFSIVDDSLCN
jgi:hypothetical protein